MSLLKMRAFRFPHVKLKVERDGTLPAARTARRLLGRRADLRVDANMAWDVEQALSAISQLTSVGIRSFEQPIAAGDLVGLAAVHQPSGLHGGEPAHLQMRRPRRRLREMP
jgi:L-alanine-DL-glutamate epimerase-like enolase superfamily enzyme